jgi:hypothetical protein
MRPPREEPIVVTLLSLFPMVVIALCNGLYSTVVTIIVVAMAIIGIDVKIDQLETRLYQRIATKDEVDQEVE